MLQLPDLSQPLNFTIAVLAILAILLARYFLVAGIFWCVFHVWRKEQWAHRKLHIRPYTNNQFKRELGWSMVTSIIFAIAGGLTLLLWQSGYTQVYTSVSPIDIIWMPVSFMIALFIHEAYYYVLHRWMHRPSVFRLVHRVHHQSHITSPWTAFSFHPVEGLLQAAILPVILMLVPMHPGVILLQLVFMSISSVVNHLDIELFSEKFYRTRLGRWMIGATHHSHHHQQYKYNFGLYFTFLDKFFATEKPSQRATLKAIRGGAMYPVERGVEARKVSE